jgi:hypothetical protein
MNVKQLVDAVLAAHPQIARPHAAHAVRTTLAVLRAEIVGLDEGRLSVGGLGFFNARRKDVERDGVTQNVRVIGFRLSPVREVATGEDAEATDAAPAPAAPRGRRAA